MVVEETKRLHDDSFASNISRTNGYIPPSTIFLEHCMATNTVWNTDNCSHRPRGLLGSDCLESERTTSKIQPPLPHIPRGELHEKN